MQAAFVQASQHQFQTFLEQLERGRPIGVLCHSDVDGLAAGAILARTLERIGHTVAVEVTGKAENAWSADVRQRLARLQLQALLVTDLGSREQPLLALPTLLIDHHRPTGVPPQATLITGYGQEPTPTSGLLAYWCAQSVAPVDDLLWIAAISLLSDIGDRAPFDELSQARQRYKATPLRDATTLLNAPRRTATGDARPALALLLHADGPAQIVRGTAPEVALLKAAKAEVNAAFAEAKKAAPVFRENVALIRMHSLCQIHPLIAQIWRTRLPKYIVLSVNTGYMPGYVHFSARSSREINVLDFLRAHAPADVDERYGNGHDQASGGALRYAAWNEFVAGLGFGPELLVQADLREVARSS